MSSGSHVVGHVSWKFDEQLHECAHPSSLLPHDGQNMASVATSFPHFGQKVNGNQIGGFHPTFCHPFTAGASLLHPEETSSFRSLRRTGVYLYELIFGRCLRFFKRSWAVGCRNSRVMSVRHTSQGLLYLRTDSNPYWVWTPSGP
jgi:hypothetical protein